VILDPDALWEVTSSTLEHYDRQGAEYLLEVAGRELVDPTAPLRGRLALGAQVLDLGCGPGRELVALADAGFQPTGLDGAESLVKLARDTGHPVLLQDFLDLRLPEAAFDGVLAVGSLYHVPTQELVRVLRQVLGATKPGGWVAAYNPWGTDSEGFLGARWVHALKPSTWRGAFERAGWVVEPPQFLPDVGPAEDRPWLLTLARRASTL